MNNANPHKTYFEHNPAHPEKFVHRTKQVEIQVEDDRTGMSAEAFTRAVLDHLYYNQGVAPLMATTHDYYMALSYTIRDRLMHRWISSGQSYLDNDPKAVFYLSAEFLMGRQLGNAILNLGCWKQARTAMERFGLSLYDVMECEAEPGLGNGGLGRLAACFLDSLATLEIPAMGYGIRYDFGIFEQTIRDGWQVERPDKWLRWGNPWEVARPDHTVEVKFGGNTEHYTDEQGRPRVRWKSHRNVLGTPYDTLIPGFRTDRVNTLRLWSAGTSKDFDFQIFDAGDYYKAVEEKTFSENISKVLYPNDNTPQGRELRLRQQYFFVSCSLQDIIRIYRIKHDSLANLHEKAAIQLNDTHPAIAVPELMRLLVDENGMDWEQAWDITRKTFAFTNHTLLPEALERWQVDLIGRLLPRHLEIIYEINRRFLDVVNEKFLGDQDRLSRMSLIEEGSPDRVRMAHLATVGSFAVNGVAKLHTELVKSSLLKDFYELWPEKFFNKTNGVTPRRWIMLANPKLTALITEKIGKGWATNLDELLKLEPYADDEMFRHVWAKFKYENKADLAEYILQSNGIEVNPESLFDVQVKRLHEYKRQLLNVLYIISLYNRVKANPDLAIQPRTFIFGAKAAPGYAMAKLIIKLINSVADVINNDPIVKGQIKVAFLSNFSVSLGQRVYPAADLSEQISLAGKEASGTGNMKFSMNGALTIGTLDGANIEIRDAVGAENFFLFGMTVEEVQRLRAEGYNPVEYYHGNEDLRGVLDSIASGDFSPDNRELFRPIVDSLLNHDQYFLLRDYQSYIEAQDRVSNAYQDHENWSRMSILNAARMGYFSSDRTIKEYCEEIWKVKPLEVELEEYNQEKVTYGSSKPSSSEGGITNKKAGRQKRPNA